MAERTHIPGFLDADFLDDLSCRVASAVTQQTGLSVAKVTMEQPFVGPDEHNGLTVYVHIRKQGQRIGGAQTIDIIRTATDAVHRVREDLYPVIVPQLARGAAGRLKCLLRRTCP